MALPSDSGAEQSGDPDGPLGWGVIGASTIGSEYVVPAIAANPDSAPVALLSRSEERGRAYAEANGIPVTYTAVDAFLADPAIDVVYVGTTNERHAELTMAAAEAGKHVLCEKPLAMTLEEAIAMRDACQSAKVVLGTNHHIRNAGTVRAVRDLIRKGAVGRVLSGRIFHAGYLPEGLQTWRLHDERAGAGVIVDETVHDVDTLRFVLDDEVVEVVAISGQLGLSSGMIEDEVVGAMRFGRGALVAFHDGYTPRYARTGLEVHGEEGSIIALDVMSQEPDGTVTLRREGGVEEIDPGAGEDLYVRAVRLFNEAVRGRGTPAATAEDGIRSLAAALAVVEAGRSGRCQTVPEPD
jgi:1,5-anhydro-D-fructose reductase (1,5-anhydro-D-mannitol-forming)